jgi:four helix bundle protein
MRKERVGVAFRFEGLEIWDKARAYSASVHAVISRLPRHEDYGLRSQPSRAANSIGLNIAEGAARRTAKAFDYHLEVAVGSVFETVAAAALALDRGYITQDQHRLLYADGESLAKSINAFRKTLH